MKTLGLLRIVIALGMSVLLSGCLCFHRTGPKAVAGTWINPYDTVLNMHCDGTYDLDYDHYRKPDSWGKYRVEGHTVSLVQPGGFVPEGGRHPGIYQFRRVGFGTLRFTPVSEPCKLRRDNMQLEWRRYRLGDEW